jgi:hypothetical protein
MIKQKTLFYTSLVIILSAMFSCRKESVSGIERGLSYYPFAKGLWWEYNVDSTFYNDFSGDTIHAVFILREEFDTFFVTDNGEKAIRIERYRKVNETDAWQGPRIWWTYITADAAVKVEENFPYVKLNFPVKQNESWNGNRLNFMESWRYSYENIDIPLTVNSNAFDSTTSILQINKETLLEKQVYREKYARNVGLIEKSVTDIKGYTDSDNIPDTIVKPLMNRIKSGVIIQQRIRSWGVE